MIGGGLVHNELKEIAKEKLIDKGYDSSKIEFEYKFITPAGRTFKIDVVAFKNGKVDTIVECGEISTLKLEILKTYFPNVIHMPYEGYDTDVAKLRVKIKQIVTENNHLKTKLNNLEDEFQEKTKAIRDELNAFKEKNLIDIFNQYNISKTVLFNQLWCILDNYLLKVYKTVEARVQEGKNDYYIKIKKDRHPILAQFVGKHLTFSYDQTTDNKNKSLTLFEIAMNVASLNSDSKIILIQSPNDNSR